ncbi:MAG: outer membrane protein assembly factor BamB [Gammaproteobacteria bacterium]|nr:MAG: outer membrane protein assembly factor BamB [Gammaproteobacteria bacterium]
MLLLASGCTTIKDGATSAVVGVTDYLAGEDNVDLPKELLPLDPQIEVTTLWKESVGDGGGEQRVALVPALFYDKIVAADRKGIVNAYKLEDGELLWEVETELLLSGGPGVGDGTVIIGTSDGQVIALSEEDGSELWRVQVTSEVLAVPQVAHGIVIIRTVDGRISGLNEIDGQQIWFYDRAVPALSLRGTSTPVVLRDIVIDGYASGKLVALRLNDGRVGWEVSIATPSGRTELDRIVDIDADPVIAGDVIYIASYHAGITAMSLGTGELLWNRREISSFAGMDAGWRYLFVTDEKSNIWALDLDNGATVWKQDELQNRQLTAPAIHDDYFVVGDYEGYLHWFSQDDGREVARLEIDGEGIFVKPVVESDVLYAYGKGGILAAVSIQ